MDKIEYYQRLKKIGGIWKSFYQPIEVKNFKNHLIIRKEKKVSIPKEGKKISAILSEKKKIDKFDYNSLKLKKDSLQTCLTIEEIYNHGKELIKKKK